MSSLAVMTSLLRSAARSATSQLGRLPFAEAARQSLLGLSLGRTAIADAQLTRALTHLPGVSAATVSSGEGRLRIDLSFEDATPLRLALCPSVVAFAPGGAKEIGFVVEPGALAGDARVCDIAGAIAAEIARALWRPALAGAPVSDHAPFISNEGERLVVDLRTVPEVRWALGQTLRAAIIEAIRPRSLAADAGHLALPLTVQLR